MKKVLLGLAALVSMSAFSYIEKPDFNCKSQVAKKIYHIHFKHYTRIYVYDQSFNQLELFDDFHMQASFGETKPVTKIYDFKYNDDQSLIGSVSERGELITFTRTIYQKNGQTINESAVCTKN